MQKLTPKAKEAIVQKALSKCGTIAEVAQANNIAVSTLYEWMKRYNLHSRENFSCIAY